MSVGIKWFQIGLGALAGFALCWMLHVIILDGVEKEQSIALEKLTDKLVAECDDAKKITEGVSNDYQKRLNDLNAELVRAKRVLPARCVAVSSTGASGGHNDSAGVGGHGPENAVRSEWLYDFAGQCERYRRQVISLQSFINQTWDGGPSSVQ